jgi:hypothetical protein
LQEREKLALDFAAAALKALGDIVQEIRHEDSGGLGR